MAGIATTLYQRIAKPIIFLFSPDRAHSMTVGLLYGLGKTPGVPALTKAFIAPRVHTELVTEWKGIHFDSPVGLGAGLDKNGQLPTMMRSFGLGFTTVGSVTARPCEGNERPWFYRLINTESMVVNVGLANLGSKKILSRLESLPEHLRTGYPTIMSIARTNDKKTATDERGIADFVASVTRAKRSRAVQAIELNISCPNAFCGETFTQPELFDRLMTAVDAVGIQKPILVKLPVDLPWLQLRQLLNVAVKHGIAGVTVSNLLKNRAQVNLKDPLPDDVAGNLSGAPLRKPSTELIRKIYATYGKKLTIVGVGGVLSAEDAYDKIRAGATFVEVVTGMILKGPFVESEIHKELITLLERDGYDHVSEAVGADFRA